MILKNVELYWANLDPENPDSGYDKATPQWNVQVRTRDKAQAQEWEKAGLKPKPDTDETGIYYKLTTKKLVQGKNGVNKPVPVIGRDRTPLHPDLVPCIGNGSIGNVKLRVFEYTNFGGGISQRLEAIQIVNLVEYKKAGNQAIEGFEEIDADDDSVDDDNPFD